MNKIKDKLLLSNIFNLFGVSVCISSISNIFKIHNLHFNEDLMLIPALSIFFFFFICWTKAKIIKKDFKIKDKTSLLLIFGLIVNISIIFSPLQEQKHFVNLIIFMFATNIMVMTIFITLYRDKSQYIENFIIENKSFSKIKNNLIFKSSFRYIEFNLNDLHFKFDRFFGQVSINSEIFDTLDFKSKLNIIGVDVSNLKSENLAIMKILNY